MTYPNRNLLLEEICGDGVVPQPGGWTLRDRSAPVPAPSVIAEVIADMPGVTQFYTDLVTADPDRTQRFLQRQPPEALDRMVQTLLPSPVPPTPSALGVKADQFGVPAQTRVATLGADRPGEAVPLADHRVVYFDQDGQMAVADRAEVVRVVPQNSLAPRPYERVSPSYAARLAGQPYPPGRIVFSAAGVELGLPAALANGLYADVLRDHPLAIGIAHLDGAFGPDAFAAVGARTVETVDGYVELLRRMQSAEPGTHGLVAVDRPDGAGTAAYLAVRGPHTVSFLDLAAMSPATFVKDPAGVRVALLQGALSVAERLAQLDAAWFDAAVETSWPLYLPPRAVALPGADPADAGDVVVVGPVDNVPASIKKAVQAAAREVDQPIVLVAVRQPRGNPDEADVAALRTMLNVYGWRGKVPVVVTYGQIAPLAAVLDEYRAPAVYRGQNPSSGAGLGGSAGGLAALNLGDPWVVRQPSGEAGAAGADEQPLTSGTLTPELVRTAAGRRRPAFGRPSVPVASFLSVPLTDTASVRKAYEDHKATLTTQLSQVTAIASRDPGFAAHHAVLNLATLKQFDSAVTYLEAPAADRPATIVQPLLSIDPQAAPDARAEAVGAMVPLLAALAGGARDDGASQAILSAIGGLVKGTMSVADVTAEIVRNQDYLPRDGNVRVGWIAQLKLLREGQLREHEHSLDGLALAILNCP